MTNSKMSKVFGSSMKSVGSSAGFFKEDNERLFIESSSALRNNNVNVFLKPSAPRFLSDRNTTTKLPLFSHNVDSSEAFEEISKISFDSTNCQNKNEPSTSGTSIISNIVKKNQDALSTINDGFNTYQDYKMFFCPAARETLHNSRMRFMHSDFHARKKNDKLLNTRNFDFMAKSFSNNPSRLLPNVMSLQNTSSFNPNYNISFNNNNNNNNIAHGVFGSETILPAERNFFQQKNLNINLSSVENHKSKNDTIKTPALSSKETGHNMLSRENFNSYKIKNIKEDKSTDSCFIRPFSKFTSGSVSLSSRLFNPNHFESHAVSNSQIDSNSWKFKPIHIPSKEIHPVSDFGFPLTRQNQLEIRSASGKGSIISVDVVINLIEGLQHAVLNSQPNLMVDDFTEQIKYIKEAVKNKSEFSFVQTVKENENASDISYSSKILGSKEKPLDASFTLKSGRDILKELVSKNGNEMSQVLSRIEEEKSVIKNLDTNDWSEEESEDSAFCFKKPKPVLHINNKKIPKIKTPLRNLALKASKKIINLKNWYPIASEKALVFGGTLENDTFIKTEAVKKRITNRRIMLINGLECNLIGPPFDATVSVFPQKITAGLKDGLTPRWKNFHQQLWKYQSVLNEENLSQCLKKKKNKVASEKVTNKTKLKYQKKKELENSNIYDTTPTKRNSLSLIKSERKKTNQSNSKITITKKNNKSFGCNKTKSLFKPNPGIKKNNTQVESFEKNIKFSKTSPKADDYVEIASRTRSGRTFRPPNFLNGNQEKQNNLILNGKFNGLFACGYSERSLYSKNPFSIKDNGINVKNKNEEKHYLHSSTDTKKCLSTMQLKRKRKITGEADSTQRKKSKVELIPFEALAPKSLQLSKIDSAKNVSKKIIESNKKTIKSVKNVKKKSENTGNTNTEDDLHEKWIDIEIPHTAKVSEKLRLNRSQLRLACTETPPLKFFNNNLKLFKSSPAMPSPEWCISQKTKAEVNQYQLRQAVLKKKKKVTRVDEKKAITKKNKNSIKSKDLKTMLNWVADETVKTPAGDSKLLRYMIPSRKKMESKEDSVDEDAEEGNFFL